MLRLPTARRYRLCRAIVVTVRVPLLPSPNNAACAPEGTQPNASGLRKNYASQSSIDWTYILMKVVA
jgi:hypothetical protein